MSLPADFSKIFGATATGGLTPISDVNYSKGWEYVGSNPPTKNDFSYLQNLSDLKSQWIYSYLTTTANAASRVVGTGSNQIPDMASFASQKAVTGWQKLPGGVIIQWGITPIINSESNNLITFPIAFPNGNLVQFTTYTNINADPATTNTYIGQIRTVGSTNMNIRNLGPNVAQYNWLAIGH